MAEPLVLDKHETCGTCTWVSAEGILQQWPDAASRQLIWRCVPRITDEPAVAASRLLGYPGHPPQTTLYMRVAAIPLHVTATLTAAEAARL